MTNRSTLKNTHIPIVSVNNLHIHFPVRQGVFNKVTGYIKAVDGVSFSIKRGEIFALVGESGCGKTTTAQAIAGLLPTTSGSITFSFSDHGITEFSWKYADKTIRTSARKQIQMIFQDPYSSLNPRMTVKTILEEPLRIHRRESRSERFDHIIKLLDMVGLSKEYLNRYPHEFSGGQRQRIGIARALATDPVFIIADEPVSALDVSIQAQIINLLQELREHYNQTQLFISHDLAVVRHMADTIAVMYHGKIVEYGSESTLFTAPLHPYTILLLESVPVTGNGRKKRGRTEPNEYTANDETFYGCLFYPRCSRRKEACKMTSPELHKYTTDHGVACFNPVE